LQALVRYAQNGQCRRELLLGYFGEAFHGPCDACDNCARAAADQQLDAARLDVTDQARLLLTCVQATGQIFGPAHIVDILCGSQNQRVVKLKHDRLAVHGAGKATRKRDWRRLANEFISQGLVEQDMQHGSLRITAKGQAVLQGERVFVTPSEVPIRLERQPFEQAYDAVLFEQLRGLRRRLADAANVPPYVVFSDRSLVEMAAYLPQTPSGFMAIDGVGTLKLERYGDAFLAVIRAYCQEHGLAEGSKPVGRFQATPLHRKGRRRFHEVGEMVASGQSIERVQVFYGVQRSTIVEHLRAYVLAGHQLDPARLRAESRLAPEDQERVLAALSEHGSERLRPIYDAQNETVPWDELHLMRLVYLLTNG
jgi:ATP-dependent DNA helicase RecQ